MQKSLNYNNIEKNIIYIISFFLFSGYYIGLGIMIATGKIESSRFYSIPIRILQFLFYIILIRNLVLRKISVSFFSLYTLFFLLYIIKILYTENEPITPDVLPLRKIWIEYIFYFLSSSYLPVLAFASFNFKKYAHVIANAIIFSTFIFAVVSIYIYREAIGTGVGRISLLTYSDSSVENTISPLALSYGSSIAICLIIYYLFFTKVSIKKKIYYYITIAVSLVIFFLGASRGSMVAIILSLILMIIYSNTKRKILIVLVFIAAIPVLYSVADKIGSNLFERTDNAIEAGDTSGRTPLWNAAWNEFLSHPILGGRIEVSGIYPHNMFLEILMATGIIGFILFLIPFIKTFFNAFLLTSKDRVYLIAFIIFINGFAQNMFSGAIYNMIFIAVGMGVFLSAKNLNN